MIVVPRLSGSLSRTDIMLVRLHKSSGVFVRKNIHSHNMDATVTSQVVYSNGSNVIKHMPNNTKGSYNEL